MSGLLKPGSLWAAVAAVVASSGCTLSHAMRTEPDRACPDPTDATGAIHWYGPQRSGDIEAQDRWCATVGSAAFDTLPPGRVVGPVDSLIVVTWNMNVGGGDVVGFLEANLGMTCDGTSHTQAAPDETGPPPVVLLLQEANRRSPDIPVAEAGPEIPDRIVPDSRPGPWLDVVELAHSCGLAFVYVPSARNGNEEVLSGGAPPSAGALREDKGNAILSTLPLRHPIAIELPFEAGRKVAVGATVALTPTDSLRLVSVHLDVASTLVRAISTGNSWRLRQGLGLVAALELADGEPQIASVAAGDFNTWSGDETVVRHMYDYFPESPPQGKRRTRGAFPTDYLFFRRADSGVSLLSGPRILPDDYYSDHLPILAVFGLVGGGRSGP